VECAIPEESVTGGSYYLHITASAPADTSLAYGPVEIVSGNSIRQVSGGRFNIYPNPVNEELTVECTRPLERIRIINIAGQQVISKDHINSPEITVNTSELAEGMYIIKIITTNGKMYVKMLNR
jgi:hypothetical protein